MVAPFVQDEWVERVLGVKDPGFVGQPPRPVRFQPVWRDATDEVDAQIEGFRQQLRSHPDPEIQQIAEFGPNRLTGKRSVALMVALAQTDAAPTPENLPALGRAVAAVRAGRDTDYPWPAVVQLREESPAGFALLVRQERLETLGTIRV